MTGFMSPEVAIQDGIIVTFPYVKHGMTSKSSKNRENDVAKNNRPPSYSPLICSLCLHGSLFVSGRALLWNPLHGKANRLINQPLSLLHAPRYKLKNLDTPYSSSSSISSAPAAAASPGFSNSVTSPLAALQYANNLTRNSLKQMLNSFSSLVCLESSVSPSLQIT